MNNSIKKEKDKKKKLELSPLDKVTILRGKCSHLGVLIKEFNLEVTL